MIIGEVFAALASAATRPPLTTTHAQTLRTPDAHPHALHMHCHSGGVPKYVGVAEGAAHRAGRVPRAARRQRAPMHGNLCLAGFSAPYGRPRQFSGQSCGRARFEDDAADDLDGEPPHSQSITMGRPLRGAWAWVATPGNTGVALPPTAQFTRSPGGFLLTRRKGCRPYGNGRLRRGAG
jgi:hypothetical protein